MADAKKFPSELRFDLVSRDWVVIATGRAKRPETFRREQGAAEKSEWELAAQNCPFEDLGDQEHPTCAFFQGEQVQLPETGSHIPEDWTTISVPNKYPAFAPGSSPTTRLIGPYHVIDGVGFHEVIITKEHTKDIPQFSAARVKELLDVYHARYMDLKEQEHVNYISIFKNKGPKAGATVAHPHSQLIAIPVTDPDIVRSLTGSLQYFETAKKCVHCTMLAWDREDRKRIVYENDFYTVVCPFASRVAFEVRIFPKEHLPYFELVNENQKQLLADAFLVTMKKLYKGLKDPDYNYFLHTAPVDGDRYDHYHWHWEILPKTSTWAGFELGAGIEISTIEPEKAAQFLRAQ